MVKLIQAVLLEKRIGKPYNSMVFSIARFSDDGLDVQEIVTKSYWSAELAKYLQKQGLADDEIRFFVRG